MNDVCELEDLSKDCCINCFNGFPAYGCPKQEEESKQLRELVHKKAIDKEQRIRAAAIDELAELIESAMLNTKFDISDVRPMAEQLKSIK